MWNKIHDIGGSLLSLGTALSGWFVIANVYLQTIAFIVSIIAGLVTIHSVWKRRRNQQGQ